MPIAIFAGEGYNVIERFCIYDDCRLSCVYQTQQYRRRGPLPCNVEGLVANERSRSRNIPISRKEVWNRSTIEEDSFWNYGETVSRRDHIPDDMPQAVPFCPTHEETTIGSKICNSHDYVWGSGGRIRVSGILSRPNEITRIAMPLE